MTFPIQNAIEDADQKVIFSAIRKNGDVNALTTITYDEASVNVGGGMDIGSGHFTIPVSGIYSFSFSGMAKFKETWTSVQVRKNNTDQFNILSNTKKTNIFDTLSTTWIMNLSQNDVISIYAKEGRFSGSPTNPILFNGHLLMKQ